MSAPPPPLLIRNFKPSQKKLKKISKRMRNSIIGGPKMLIFGTPAHALPPSFRSKSGQHKRIYYPIPYGDGILYPFTQAT